MSAKYKKKQKRWRYRAGRQRREKKIMEATIKQTGRRIT